MPRRKPRLPDVPDIDVIPPVNFSRGANGDKSFYKRRDALEIARIFNRYQRGEKTFLTAESKMSKMHGCRMCPYWGSSRCYHDLPYGKTHANGICEERLSEIMEYVRMGFGYSGKEARRNEVIHKIQNHIIALESHLVDYRQKRLEEIMQKKLENSGVDLSGESSASVIRSHLSKEELAYDRYETNIMGQIQLLADKFAAYLHEDMKLEKKFSPEKGKDQITPMQIGEALRKANAELLEGSVEYDDNPLRLEEA